MDRFDGLRASMGLPTSFGFGRSISVDQARAQEQKRNTIVKGCENYVVKLECEKDGQVVGHFSGIMYHGDSPLILTCGRMVEYNGATTYFALFYDGTTLQKRCLLKVLDVGRAVGEQITSAGASFVARVPDVALFECDYVPAHGLRPYAATLPSVGGAVLIVGFKGKEEPQLSFAEGLMSYAGFTATCITAHVDEGYSGCPVFNSHGYVIGMVRGSEEHSVLQVLVVPAASINFWLQYRKVPYPVFKG